MTHGQRKVSRSVEVSATPEEVFDLLADPRRHPELDGSGTLTGRAVGPDRLSLGARFGVSLHFHGVPYRVTNTVVEFEEGRLIAWRPSEPSKKPPGHLWRWELEPLDHGRTRVTHTYDWTELTDNNRIPRAKATTTDKLLASIDRLAALAEAGD